MGAIAALLLTGTQARAAALIGETRAIEASPAPEPDARKQQYRQPESIPFPVDNAYTPEKAFLGRVLFNDPRLSSSGMLSCASCHNPGFGYSDSLARSQGEIPSRLARRTPSIVNSAWGRLFAWDGSMQSLEEQALIPIQSRHEMNQTLDRLVRTLSETPQYADLFRAAFKTRGITAQTVAEAIATFERTIVSGAAPFDFWLDGDESAISAGAKRGFDLFNGKARCASCHGGWLLTDDGFHDIGLPDDDLGRGNLYPNVNKLQHAFKTPSLREIGLRRPYMHDGSLPDLKAVIAHYDHGAVKRSSRSELISPLGLSVDEQDDLVAFLQTLTSSDQSGAFKSMPH